MGFKSNYERYYQITAIDLYSRKRKLKLVNENSTYETSKTLKTLEKEFGFKIKTVQTDNGKEFCNDREQKKSEFEKVLEYLEIEYIKTRPYSPWQNGVVERSHKIDNDLFYSKKRFKSEEEMYKAFQRYSVRTNNIARRVLSFKTPNEMKVRFAFLLDRNIHCLLIIIMPFENIIRLLSCHICLITLDD
ncbi:DDE-type integrase/transposase/recombinase [Helcococcus ovis]